MLGVPVLDLDRVGFSLQQRPDIIAQLVHRFGQHIACNGLLNRPQLRAICFADPDNMKQLEAIMHPPIWQQVRQWRNQHQATYGIIEASSLRQRNPEIDTIITVVTPQNIRHQRVLARGNQTLSDLQLIDRLQSPPQGDFIIKNGGDIKSLDNQVKTLHIEHFNNDEE